MLAKSFALALLWFDYPVSSAIIQKNVVTWVTGLPIRQLTIVRIYYERPKGQPGNSDLCEHQIKVNDETFSIWFDLYLVTKQGKDAGVPQNPVAQRIRLNVRNRTFATL